MQHSINKNFNYKKKILFICGSLNQTTMMYQISEHLTDFDYYFTPYYADGYLDKLASQGYLDFSILGGNAKQMTLNFLEEKKVKIDNKALSHYYDLVLTCSDLLIQKNIRHKKIVLVQEGMTDPKNIAFYLVKWFKLPRYIASTSTNGLSDLYEVFCVASEGYKDAFIKNGIKPEKIAITGIPNYDNCTKYYDNNFPHKNYVIVATSDTRETLRYENRKKFIQQSLEIAAGRQLIFKLHPNENFKRAIDEIRIYAPEALVYADGNVHEMIANCDVLITKYSTCVYTGIALGKEVYSYFDINELKKLAPIQNKGTSSIRIAEICRRLLNEENVIINTGFKNSFKSRVRTRIKDLASFLLGAI